VIVSGNGGILIRGHCFQVCNATRGHAGTSWRTEYNFEVEIGSYATVRFRSWVQT
jgi:hypothetical protein